MGVEAADRQDNLLAGRVDAISPKAAIARATMSRLAALAAERLTVLPPAHDPGGAERLTRGKAAPTPKRATARALLALGPSRATRPLRAPLVH
jgi:glyoxylase-like metal-dependent hydrolase (beta-lactamase superfamily II)